MNDKMFHSSTLCFAFYPYISYIGKRTNPGKPGKCEIHLWNPTLGSKVINECVTATFGPKMPKEAVPVRMNDVIP